MRDFYIHSQSKDMADFLYLKGNLEPKTLIMTQQYVTREGGGTCYVGVSRDVQFQRVYFVPKISKAGYQF